MRTSIVFIVALIMSVFYEADANGQVFECELYARGSSCDMSFPNNPRMTNYCASDACDPILCIHGCYGGGTTINLSSLPGPSFESEEEIRRRRNLIRETHSRTFLFSGQNGLVTFSDAVRVTPTFGVIAYNLNDGTISFSVDQFISSFSEDVWKRMLGRGYVARMQEINVGNWVFGKNFPQTLEVGLGRNFAFGGYNIAGASATIELFGNRYFIFNGYVRISNLEYQLRLTEGDIITKEMDRMFDRLNDAARQRSGRARFMMEQRYKLLRKQ